MVLCCVQLTYNCNQKYCVKYEVWALIELPVLFHYERDFKHVMMSLSDDKQADIIDTFNTTSRYLDDILNINNICFDNIVS